MLARHRNVAVFVTLAVAFFLWLKPSKWNSSSPLQYLTASRMASPDIFNATLGFQHIYTINLPARTDRRDAMTLAASLSGLDITWVDGVAGKDVSDKVLPGGNLGAGGLPTGNKGSWRAHMDVLQRIVWENVTSALILEDDADWDIRLKPQMQVFAHAARAFTQPSPATGQALAEQSHIKIELPLDQLPNTLRPVVTPYGDAWDVLWLGHCGTSFPSADHQPPLLRITIPNDPTVPTPRHLKPHPFALQDRLAELYPPYTRVVHASSETTCTQAYAVSQRGARMLLWRFGLVEGLTKGWDFLLRDWCDGLYSSGNTTGDKNGSTGRPVCVTVQPPLFSHHFGKGAASDIMAPGGGFVNREREMTPYVRRSVRLNMGRLVQGEGAVDQWEEEG